VIIMAGRSETEESEVENLETSKTAIFQLLKTDTQFRDEVKEAIRQVLRPQFDAIIHEFIPAIHIDDVAKQFPGCKHSVWYHYDTSGAVYGAPSEVEVDILSNDEVTYMCQIRNVISQADVLTMVRIGKLYASNITAGSLRCIMVCHGITPKVRRMAERAKIDILIASR